MTIFMIYDRVLLWLLLGLMTIGFIMVSSSSIVLGCKISSFFFVKRVVFYYCVTLILSAIILNVSMITWKNYSYMLLLCSLFVLLILLIQNNTINGASRWIIWGSFYIQPSELSKLSFICYLSDYLDRKSKEVRNTFWGLLKPIIVMTILAFLLLVQPDFGSIIILFVTTLFILFLFGAKLWQLVIIFLLKIFLITLSIISKPYRIQRILAFWDPWRDPFGNGYQLIQSFIAFGRGNLFGQGLGNSIQKLEYLPEAHTDFVFSILAEELGLVGSALVLFMLFMIVYRSIIIGRNALNLNHRFSGILSCSIGIWIGLQTFLNVGVATGIVPTKGLTLPFISYGGSSFLITTIAIILVIRVDFETRLAKNQVFYKDNIIC